MREEDSHRLFWVVALIIGFITGIFLALMGPNVVHFVLFDYGDNFLVSTPLKANVLVGVSALVFCLACVIMMFERKRFKVIGSILLLIFTFTFYSGFTYYSVFSDQEITVSTPLTNNTYSWTDIEEAKMFALPHEDVITSGIELTFNDGRSVEISVHPMEGSKISRIVRHVRAVGVNPAQER